MPFDESALFLECSYYSLFSSVYFVKISPSGFPPSYRDLFGPIRDQGLLSILTYYPRNTRRLSRSIRPHIGSESLPILT